MMATDVKKVDEDAKGLLESGEEKGVTIANGPPSSEQQKEGYFTDYPKHVLLIFVTVFFERFAYHGLTAILVIYLWNAIALPKSQATAVYHAFHALAYFTPLLGAVLADAYFGKFRYGPLIGLLFIAIGAGGIKPCVSSFGGDQFKAHQMRQKESFFSVFYVSMNIGALLSKIVPPIIRGRVFCFNTNCYALALGLPAILVVCALVIFSCGFRWYTNVPPTESVISRLARCVAIAIYRKCKRKDSTEKKQNWLDYAEPDYDHQFISDAKDATRVIWMFLPLPIFWTLFDQMGSRWTLQAAHMDGDLGSYVIEPDILQSFNPLLVIIFIPVLEGLLFPGLKKCGIPFRPLQRISVGMLLTSASFIIATVLQAVIDKDVPAPFSVGQTRVQFINTSPCYISVSTTTTSTSTASQLIEPFANTGYNKLEAGNLTLTVNWSRCEDLKGQPVVKQFQFQFQEKKAYQVFLGNDLKAHEYEQKNQTQTENLLSTIRFYNSLDVSFVSINVTTSKGEENVARSLGSTAMRSVSEYEMIILVNHTVEVFFSDGSKQRISTEVYSRNGAVYTIILRNQTTPEISSSSPSSPSSNQDLHLEIVQLVDIPPWSVNIAWQFPQYFVITAGECLFSITGLAFAYSQAPVSMKSFLMANWHLTQAFGNIIVIIVASFEKVLQQVYEFALFGCLMFATTIIFIVFSLFYQYVDLRVSDDQPSTQSPTAKGEKEEQEEKGKEKGTDGEEKSKEEKIGSETTDLSEASSKAVDASAEEGQMEERA